MKSTLFVSTNFVISVKDFNSFEEACNYISDNIDAFVPVAIHCGSILYVIRSYASAKWQSNVIEYAKETAASKEYTWSKIRMHEMCMKK